MERYRVLISRPAQKVLNALNLNIRKRIFRGIFMLESNPRPFGVKKMVGEPNTYRIRIGDYRVLYEIRDDRLLVHVVKVAHRRDVYR